MNVSRKTSYYLKKNHWSKGTNLKESYRVIRDEWVLLSYRDSEETGSSISNISLAY